MAKPRVFISSTFYDLKQVRSSLEVFIRGLGFDPVLSEKGSIAYTPDVPLDESCYREAQGCDVFVLIIGGRYGSEVSGDKRDESNAETKGFLIDTKASLAKNMNPRWRGIFQLTFL
jgi:hypothetical protein